MTTTLKTFSMQRVYFSSQYLHIYTQIYSCFLTFNPYIHKHLLSVSLSQNIAEYRAYYFFRWELHCPWPLITFHLTQLNKNHPNFRMHRTNHSTAENSSHNGEVLNRLWSLYKTAHLGDSPSAFHLSYYKPNFLTVEHNYTNQYGAYRGDGNQHLLASGGKKPDKLQISCQKYTLTKECHTDIRIELQTPKLYRTGFFWESTWLSNARTRCFVWGSCNSG